jgi:cytochrome c peroxidase
MRSVICNLLFALLVLISACQRDSREDASTDVPSTTPYTLEYPSYFPEPTIPASNPLTQEGIALGRRLYYDTLFSRNGPFEGFACATCHDQDRSFTVPTAGTNVLAHVNLAWSTHFLWNGKVSGTLEDVMRFEVEEFFQVDVTNLNAHPEYPSLFQRTFGSSTITNDLVIKALAQWFRRMTSSNNRFDQYMKGEISLTPQEMEGAMIFLSEIGDCFHCHVLPLMTDNTFHNIGLSAYFTGTDVGRFAITGAPMDMGAFKTPTLRNIALTAPYMHDGRFQTLEEVVDFYSGGVQHSASLDPIMTKPGTITTLGLTPQQKASLISFLHTLTDETFVTDPALADPF